MPLRSMLRATVSTLVSAALVAAFLVVDAPSSAAPARTVEEFGVWSAAMAREIPVRVLRPAGRPADRPTLYLLNGAGGGEDEANWFDQTDLVEFLADREVNVVVPMEGAFSYYTDWRRDDPVLGRNKWTTFLTRELPPAIDARLDANGVNAIAGISMAGTSVLSLAENAPGLYRAVAAYSGCAETSTPFGQAYIRIVVAGRGGGDVENMWGPVDGPGWRANDPVVHAAKLRGTRLYISNGSGLPGPHDRLDSPGIDGDVPVYLDRLALGTVIEWATGVCTRNLQARLARLGIPAVFHFREVGTHTWAYWQDEFHRSWPMLERALR